MNDDQQHSYSPASEEPHYYGAQPQSQEQTPWSQPSLSASPVSDPSYPVSPQPQPFEPQPYQPAQPTNAPQGNPYQQPVPVQPQYGYGTQPVSPYAQPNPSQSWNNAQGTPFAAGAPTTQSTEPQTPAPFGAQPQFAPAPGARPPRKSRRPLAIGLAAAVAVVLAGSSTFVFAYYIPTRPENVWGSGLANSGRALTSLNDKLTSSDNLNKLSKYELSGTFDATEPADASTGTDAISVKGTLSMKADGTHSNSAVTGSVTSGSKTMNLSLNSITNPVANSPYPDVYLQVSGIKDLGLDDLFPGVSTYDGKWISIPSTYLQQTLKDQGTTSTDKSVTKEDVAEFSTAVTKVISNDVFTSNANKSILVRKDFIGHEKKNDRDSYHYTATVSAAHAATFCKDLSTAISTTSLYKKLNTTGTVDSDTKDCTDYFAKSFPESKTIDVWMDSGYRVLSAIRFNPNTSGTDTTEIGQTFVDITKPSFYVSGTSADSGTGKVTMTVDQSSLDTTLDVDITSKDASKLTAHAEVKPYDGSFQSTPPTATVPIQDVLNTLGVGDTSTFDDSSSTLFQD